MGVRIKRGADKTFLIKLRKKNGDPVDLTDAQQVTVDLPKRDGSIMKINLDQIPAAKSKASYGGVVFTAQNAGVAGNAITLIFDGVKTITQVLSDWNTLNPSNQAVSNAQNPLQVLNAAQVKLTGGFDAFFNLLKLTPVVLGVLKVKLAGFNTRDLKIANQQAISVWIDSALDQDVDDEAIIIPDALDVLD